MNRTILQAVAVLTLSTVMASCSDSPSEPADRIGIRLEGRTERSSVLQLTATENGVAIPADSVTWTTQPASAIQLLAGNQAKLLTTGTVRFIASARGQRANLEIVVVAPPRIVFTKGLANDKDIWAVDLDGANLVRLTTTAGDDESPSVGGSSVYFRSSQVSPQAVYRVPLAGGAAERVTTDASIYTDPAISPDGARLSFTRVIGGYSKIFVSAPSGTSPVRAVTAADFADGIEAGARWSPDARSLAFVSTANGSSDIYAAEVGATPRRITNNFITDISPSWSTDGTKLTYIRGSGVVHQILVFDLATSTERSIFTLSTPISSPVYVRDTRIVYAVGTPQNSELFWTDTLLPGVSVAIPSGPAPSFSPVPARN